MEGVKRLDRLLGGLDALIYPERQRHEAMVKAIREPEPVIPWPPKKRAADILVNGNTVAGPVILRNGDVLELRGDFGDCLPHYAAWARSLEVDAAVREGFRRLYAHFSDSEPLEKMRRVSDSEPLYDWELGSILEAWREAHPA